jgi:translation initiation factor 3 subunit L
MLGLLAIVTHICPPTGLVEDVVLRTVREKYGPQLSKVDAGEDGYESLFVNCCPKFVSPAMPDFTQPFTDSHDAFKFQVKLFMKEMTSQQAYRKLRSYLKLYTSIEVSKLAKFNDSDEEHFVPLLLSFKSKMRQLENPNLEETSALEGDIGSALDIHYYVVENVVHVDEAEKQRRFENYFMAQINQNVEIMKDVEAINTAV